MGVYSGFAFVMVHMMIGILVGLTSSAIKYECALFPEDIIKRRSSVYYFDPESIHLVNETALKLLNPINE